MRYKMAKTYSRFSILCSILFLLLGCAEKKPTEIITVDPEINHELLAAAPNRFSTELTLKSLKKTGDLFTAVFYGGYSQLMNYYHKEALQQAKYLKNQEKDPLCSMFTFFGNQEKALYGRNFDNVFSELVVGYYFPKDGYSSMAFTPLMLFGFDKKTRFNMGNPYNRAQLVACPAYSIEGMNEMGITVSLAYMNEQKISLNPEKEPKFLIHLVREILDKAGSLEEAIQICLQYNVFDHGLDILSHRIFIGAPDGRSVVLECGEGKMNLILNEESWQAVTNSLLFNVPEERRRMACSRYDRISRTLSAKVVDSSFCWEDGMDLLRRLKQVNRTYTVRSERLKISTQWSAVFNMKAREAYICLWRDYEKVYRFGIPER